MTEMRIRKDAPSVSRPSSPDRQPNGTPLSAIPEVVPGPNAFAQHAVRMEKHRMEGNAFYQQEVQKRKATPPAVLHPAMRRETSASDPPQYERASTITTLSPFIAAGTTKDSPELRLISEDTSMAEPTWRGYIEERHEQMLHEASGSEEERVPIFYPTPKITTTDFAAAHPPRSKTPGKTREKQVAILEPNKLDREPLKSPKRGIFERLRFASGRSGSPSTATLSSIETAESDEKIPPKAQALLGESPSRAKLLRSPSNKKKKKGLFSRRQSDVTDVSTSRSTTSRKSPDTVEEPPNTATTNSTWTKTPQTSFSDPSHDSYISKRNISHPILHGSSAGDATISDNKGNIEDAPLKCGVLRSQSLQYFDKSIPPTPPTKDTPPDEKTKKASLTAQTNSLPHSQSDTPPLSRSLGMISTNGRISPTKYGSYGRKENVKLISQPSLYSLHASVIPDIGDATTLEEMQARFDGLGLESCDLRPESFYHPGAGMIYSPSIYSVDWGSHSIANRSPLHQRMNNAGHTPMAPPMFEENDSPAHSKTSSTSASGSGETVEMWYPELAKDPSFSNLTTLRSSQGHTSPSAKMDFYNKRLDLDCDGIPKHGKTHSRDHSASPRTSAVVSMFSKPVQDESLFHQFQFDHPSAAPSPLQFLPATVYTPPQRKPVDATPCKESINRLVDDEATPRPVARPRHEQQIFETPVKRSIFDNVPLLSPPDNKISDCTTDSPRDSVTHLTEDEDVDNTSNASEQITPDVPDTKKLDRILANLELYNNNVNASRRDIDELKENQERYDKRFAAEDKLKQRGKLQHVGLRSNAAQHRALRLHPQDLRPVDDIGDAVVNYTVDARSVWEHPLEVVYPGSRDERLKTQEQQPLFSERDVTGAENNDGELKFEGRDTIDMLLEENKRLKDLVGGFARKLEQMSFRRSVRAESVEDGDAGDEEARADEIDAVIGQRGPGPDTRRDCHSAMSLSSPASGRGRLSRSSMN